MADLFRERGQVGGVGRGEDTVHGGALGFEDGGDRVHVVLAERVLLGEDHDVLAFGVVHERTRGENVLVGLAAGTERVVVDAGDGVGGGRSRDEQHLVLFGERGDLDGHAGRGGPGDDVVAFADEFPGRGHRLGGVASVIPGGDFDGPAVDFHGAAGGVFESGFEALVVLLAVGGERPAHGVDEADFDGAVSVACGGALRAAAGGEDESTGAERGCERCVRGITHGLLQVSPPPCGRRWGRQDQGCATEGREEVM